jgi:hypothetical protein
VTVVKAQDWHKLAGAVGVGGFQVIVTDGRSSTQSKRTLCGVSHTV